MLIALAVIAGALVVWTQAFIVVIRGNRQPQLSPPELRRLLTRLKLATLVIGIVGMTLLLGYVS